MSDLATPIKILDIGCAKSEILISSYRHCVSPLEYHGIDLNVRDLRQTLANVFTKTPYYLYHLSVENRLPFPRNYFDVILMLDIIEHMPTLDDGYKLFKSALRYLKPGGKLFLITPNKENAD
jgi:ubiquinone/menaquinone biosynthesis C-methylase UbiE